MLEARNMAWDAIAGLPVVEGRERVGELRIGGRKTKHFTRYGRTLARNLEAASGQAR